MQCDRQNFVILDYFLPFYAPPNNQENQNSKKKKKKVKKIPGDIIILHMCTIHEDHTMSGS